jgi:hypothetical protein
MFKTYDPALLMKRWAPWVKAVKNDEGKITMATLLENQLGYCKGSLLKEQGVTSSDAGVFQKVILPVIRRVYPRLVAPELVGVQPMTGPHGVVVYMRYLYENGNQILQPQGNADGRRIRFSEYEGSAYLSVASAVEVNEGAGLFHRVYAFATTVFPAGAGTTYANWTGQGMFKVNMTVGGLTDTVTIINLSNPTQADSFGGGTATAPSWAANSAAGVFTFTTAAPTAVDEICISASPTGYTAGGNSWTIQTFGAATVNTQQIPGAATDVAEALFLDAIFLDNSGCPLIISKGVENQTPATVNVKLDTHPVEAENYKLQAAWSLEANQDIANLHGEKLEDLLANLLTQELLNEIDYLIVRDLLSIAGLRGSWNKFPGLQTTTGANTTMPAYRGSLREHWETLVFAMNDMANSIQTRILRGPANFAVCSPDVATVLESLPDFRSTGDFLDIEVGVTPVGSIASKYKVFKDPRLAKGTMLMGYKGKDAQSTGYAYCPYIPATLGPVVMNPSTYQQSRLIMSRFGRTTLLDGQFYYGVLSVSETNLATSDWTAV